ncbi:unnamed protein product [Leptidea sinapis]|uniref:DUF4794 domain-containing protein n=1 Tax=Leptidea sinapis TaxID=189913 RepID=A0A5E4PWJ8_9NEOP|nr:unnamed protein product [Leptidea sinapis]
MKFFLVAAACFAVAVAGPTRGILEPESAGPIIIDEDNISVGPAIIKPEESGISVGPAFADNYYPEQPALVQIVININNKSHVVDIPVGGESINTDPALVVDEEIKPEPVDVIDVAPAEIGQPELPILVDPAQNLPEALN